MCSLLKVGFHWSLACFAAVSVYADRTFVWSGSDSRFSGWFSISEVDFERRSFDRITRSRFEFLDAQNPVTDVILDDPRGFYPANTFGRLTADGKHLLHAPHPDNPNVSFWVAMWQYPGISVGLYGSQSGDGPETITYANYNLDVMHSSSGIWTLAVPEPSILWLLSCGSAVILFARAKRKYP